MQGRRRESDVRPRRARSSRLTTFSGAVRGSCLGYFFLAFIDIHDVFFGACLDGGSATSHRGSSLSERHIFSIIGDLRRIALSIRPGGCELRLLSDFGSVRCAIDSIGSPSRLEKCFKSYLHVYLIIGTGYIAMKGSAYSPSTRLSGSPRCAKTRSACPG